MMISKVLASQVMGGLVVLYLVGLLAIARYLRRNHAEVWTDLGSPSLFNWSIVNSIRLFNYVVFRKAYRSLNDERLRIFVWLERLIFIVLLVATLVWIAYFAHRI